MSPDPSNNPFLQFFKTDDKELKAFVERVLNAYKQIEKEQANSAEAITKKATEEAKKLNDEHEKLTKERLQKEKEAEIAAMKDKKKRIEEEFIFKKTLIEESIDLLQKQKDAELKRIEEQKQKVTGDIQAEQALESDKAAIILSYKNKIDTKNKEIHAAEKERDKKETALKVKNIETVIDKIKKVTDFVGKEIGGVTGKLITQAGDAISNIKNAYEQYQQNKGNVGTFDQIFGFGTSAINSFQTGQNRGSSKIGSSIINSAITGMQIAGPVGALAGAVIGGTSGLFGWLFGPSKLQRELTTIGQINKLTPGENSNNKIVHKIYNNSIIGVNTVPYNDLYRHYQEQALKNNKFIQHISNPIAKTLAIWVLIPNLQN